MPILNAHKPLAAFISTALHAIAREERRGRKLPRLTEPGLATWEQLRGRLNEVDLIELILEDARVTQPFAFDPRQLQLPNTQGPADWRRLDHAMLKALIKEVHEASDEDYLTLQATRLGLTSRHAKSDLPRGVKPHHRVLELPGSGGLLAHHLISTLDALSLREVFTICCADWTERLMAAWVAVESNIEATAPMILDDPDLAHARQLHALQPFDYIIGLSTEKGGAFSRAELQTLFPALDREIPIALV